MAEGTSQGSSTQRKRTRGITTLSGFVKNAALVGGKYHVDVDPNTGVVGGTYKPQFSTYSALLVKNKVSILIPEWKDVDEQTKTLLWKDLTMLFDIPDTSKNMQKWLTKASKLWRDYKSILTRTYIFGDGDNDGNRSPVGVYASITQEIWDAFVRSRLENTEFQEKRERYKKLQSKNLYPHHTSRGGYSTLKKKEKEKWLSQRQTRSDGGDPNVVDDDMPPSPPKHKLWLLGRINKKTRTISHEPTSQVALRIESLVEEANRGTFVPDDPRTDILSVALGTAEHRGRVRTAGHGVGLKAYYGGCRRRNMAPKFTQEDLAVVVNMVRQENWEEFMQQQHMQQHTPATVTPEMREHIAAEIRAEMEQMYAQQQSVHQEERQQLAALANKASTKAGYSAPEENENADWVALARDFMFPDCGYVRLPVSHMSDYSITIDTTELSDILRDGKWLADCIIVLTAHDS